MDILEHLGMKEPDIEGHGVIIGRANRIYIADTRRWHCSLARGRVATGIFIIIAWAGLDRAGWAARASGAVM